MNDKAEILVVDYRRNVFLAKSRLMKEAGYEALEASSGKGSLKIIREDHPDLVLLEARLPDMDGIEICKRFGSDPNLRAPLAVFLFHVRTSSGGGPLQDDGPFVTNQEQSHRLPAVGCLSRERRDHKCAKGEIMRKREASRLGS